MYKVRKKDAFYLMLKEFDYKIESIKDPCDEFDNVKREIIGLGMLEISKNALKDISDIATKELAIKFKEIVELTKFKGNGRFYKDRTFLRYEPGDNLYITYQLMNEFVTNLKKLIRGKNYVLIRDIIKILRPTSSVTINRILTWIYGENPEFFKDEAYGLLSIPDALLEIGSGYCSDYDARSLLSKIYPLFNQKQRNYIEDTILKIEPERERQKNCLKYIGKSKYLALSAVPVEYRSKIAQKAFLELERKFGALSNEKSKSMEFKEVLIPIPDNATKKMNWNHWLGAFKKYDDDTSWNGRKENFTRDGVIELALSFGKTVQETPDYFYDFVFNLYKENVSLNYVSEAINGFIGAGYDYQKIKALILKYTKYKDYDLQKSIISAIDALDKIGPIDSELFNVLADYALNAPDPCKELPQVDNNCNGEDAFFDGINTIRGSAALAITHHGFRTGDSESVFEVLEKIAEDTFVSVRSCIISDLAGMLKWDPKRTFSIYKKVINNMDIELLTHSGRFLEYALDGDNFKEIVPFLKQMSVIDKYDTSESAGRIAMIATLRAYRESEALLKELLLTSSGFREGVADICMHNISHDGYKKLCKYQLEMLLNVYSEDVTNKIAWYFNGLGVKDFDTILFVLEKFSTFNIKNSQLSFFMDYLLKCVSIYPEKCIDLINNFVNSHNLNNERYMFADNVVSIVTGAYLRTSEDEHREKALCILDKMFEIGYYNVRKLVADHDR